jgi:RHS repeat-associated protein
MSTMRASFGAHRWCAALVAVALILPPPIHERISSEQSRVTAGSGTAESAALQDVAPPTPAPEQSAQPLDTTPDASSNPGQWQHEEAFAAEAPSQPWTDAPSVAAQIPGGSDDILLSAGVRSSAGAGLPLALALPADAEIGPVIAHVATLPLPAASRLSPFGFAFTIQLRDAETGGDQDVHTSRIQTQPLELTLDYGAIPLPYGGDVSSRLRIIRASGCRVDILVEASESLERGWCATWEPLPTTNDLATQRLTATLSDAPVTVAPEPSAPDAPSSLYSPPLSEGDIQTVTASSSGAATSLYLPFVAGAGTGAGDVIYVLASDAYGPTGDYRAAQMNLVDDYAVALFSGAFATAYPIALPPATAGATPDLALTYNSGSVDAMHNVRNPQGSTAGLGWQMNYGYIAWSWNRCTGCSPVVYTLNYNGMSARLVQSTGSTFRLENDPYWRITQEGANWLVVQPDGTRLRFGQYLAPETGVYEGATDSNAKWLARSEDPNGNLTSYFYDGESGRYTNASGSQVSYTRARHLVRIEYTKRVGQAVQPHARVLFNSELRCNNNLVATECNGAEDFPDAPTDLNSGQTTPTYWSERRLDNIQTQLFDPNTAQWRTVAIYDLAHAFQGQPATSQTLVLSEIVQRPGGAFQRSAYSQIEAEHYDTASTGLTQETESSRRLNGEHWGRTPYMRSNAANTYLVFRDVDFGSGAGQLLARYSIDTSTLYGIDFRLDSITGPTIAAIPSQATWSTWKNVAVTVSGASGIHDLYVVFRDRYMDLDWLRFVPSGALPGLPGASYTYALFDNGAEDYITLALPRLQQIVTELGGVVAVTYGQSHACTFNRSFSIRLGTDCYPVYTPAMDTLNNPVAAVTFWNRWKVMQLSQSDGVAVSPSAVYTYTYSAPIYRYASDPPLYDINATCPNGPRTCNKRHWNEFRGHAVVTVQDSSGARTEYRFHQGMDGDRLGYTGGSFAAAVTLSDGSTRTDSNWLRGQEIEVRRLSAAGAPAVRSVAWYTSTLTAGSGATGAYFTAIQKTEQTLYGTASKTTRVEYAYDAYGNVQREVQHGDITTTDDDRTVERGYVYNTTAYIVNRPQWEKLWAGATSGTAGQELAYTAYAYDGQAVGVAPTQGNLTLTRAYSQVTPTAAYVETTTVYDAYGRPTTVTDANGHATTTTYHPFYGYAQSVTNALNQSSYTTVDAGWGAPTSLTDLNGRVTTLQYDAFGRLSKVWLPTEPTNGAPSKEFVYAPDARPAWVKSRQLQDAGAGNYLESWSYFDGFGRSLQSQTSLANGNRRVIATTYNALGQVAYTSASYEAAGAAGSGLTAPAWSSLAHYTYTTYDALGRPLRVETRSGATQLWVTHTTYDGWTTSRYDANDHRRDTLVDAFGQTRQVVEYNLDGAHTTHYAYDLAGRLTGVADALGAMTSISYDLLGRKTGMIDPDMGSWQYGYDSAGNLTSQRDGAGRWLHLEYDALNRLVRKRQDSPGGPVLAEWVYDAAGQLGLLSKSLAYSSQGTTEVWSVTYDALNRPAQQQWSAPGGGVFRFDATYTALGQRATLRYPGGNAGQPGELVTFGYNAVGQLNSVTGDDGTPYVASMSYNAQGQVIEQRMDAGANGLTRQALYNPGTLRLETLKAGVSAPFETLQKLSFTYDAAGNVQTLTDATNGGQVQSFGYDWLDRLTAAATNAVGVGQYNHTYQYNAIGNITNYNGNAYTYGSQPHAVTAAFGNSYAYDANGNQTSRTIGGVSYAFTYDYENRLIAISGGSVTASFVYDAEGNRVKGTVNGVTTVYVAGIYEWQNGATTRYYEGGAMRRTGYAGDNGVFYLLQDHLQSSSVIVNQNGTVNSRNYFYPFGGNRGGAAFSALTTKRFTGQYHEAGLPGGEGLSYYGARWYDPQVGRFVSADTLVPSPGNLQAFNRYSYVKNQPLNRIDPTGHADAVAPDGGAPPWWKNPHRSPTNVYLPITYQTIRNAGGSSYGIGATRARSQASYSFPTFPSRITGVAASDQPRSWQENMRGALPVAKALYKQYWGCALGNCNLSMQDWTNSVDASGMWAWGITVRGAISIAVDHTGGIALVTSVGGGGSTPVENLGLGITATNAPGVEKLSGYSVQAGGSIDAGVGIMAEGVFFSDGETNQPYYGLSISGIVHSQLLLSVRCMAPSRIVGFLQKAMLLTGYSYRLSGIYERTKLYDSTSSNFGSACDSMAHGMVMYCATNTSHTYLKFES